MKFLFKFLEASSPEQSVPFPYLKCSAVEAGILRYMTMEFLKGSEDFVVSEILKTLFQGDNGGFAYLHHLKNIKNLLELGWITHDSLLQAKLSEVSSLELLHGSIALSSSFLKLLEDGEASLTLPEAVPYSDHLEYLKDQFLRIDLLRQLYTLRQSHAQDSPSVSQVKEKLKLLEGHCTKRLALSERELNLELFFKENTLSEKEKIIFLALLKEEYSGGDDRLRDMTSLIDLVSEDEYDRIKNRALLDERSPLLENGWVDYEEMLTSFGGISRIFFIPEEFLQKITHPQKKKKTQKITLQSLIKEQDIFEFIEPKTQLSDVVLHPETEKTLDNLLRQMDHRVIARLKAWGIKEKKRGIDARIIFYGAAGTGKTMTALSLAKSLKKPVMSFDCSKILSMYVGESEKNVRRIFDSYRELAQKSKTEPILLLDEADQFLSMRTTVAAGGAEKSHNQMQNIFLEQIEKFEGILIATTNLLETIDSAFSRRFNYKIEFKKPSEIQRIELWKRMVPKEAKFEKGFSEAQIISLAKYPLTGGQIHLVIKNTAYRVAASDEPIFHLADFEEEIKKELSGNFGGEKSMGFVL